LGPIPLGLASTLLGVVILALGWCHALLGLCNNGQGWIQSQFLYWDFLNRVLPVRCNWLPSTVSFTVPAKTVARWGSLRLPTSLTAQFGSVFSPGSANSVSKLTNMFKKDKKGPDAPVTDPYSQGGDSSLPPTPSAGGMGGSSASLPPTPRGRRGAPPKGQGGFSEVDLWRPQSTEERQQCMDAYDHKVSLHLVSVMY
jgi:hypothetical protein